MSAKVILCECPICEKEFLARHDQMRSAIASGREVPCCSKRCDRERRYAPIRNERWEQEQTRIVNGLLDAIKQC